jgi:hypothetical protein
MSVSPAAAGMAPVWMMPARAAACAGITREHSGLVTRWRRICRVAPSSRGADVVASYRYTPSTRLSSSSLLVSTSPAQWKVGSTPARWEEHKLS